MATCCSRNSKYLRCPRRSIGYRLGRMPEKGKTQAKRLLEKEVEALVAKHEFKHIVCIADGARELWQYFRRKYPNATHVVDFFHVCEHLSNLSQLFFQDPSDATVWYKNTERC